VILLICLIIHSNWKLSKIIRTYPEDVKVALASYQKASLFLAGALFIDVFGLFVINTDVLLRLADHKTPISNDHSGFILDFFAAIFNIGITMSYIFGLMLIHRPKGQIFGSDAVSEYVGVSSTEEATRDEDTMAKKSQKRLELFEGSGSRVVVMVIR